MAELIHLTDAIVRSLTPPKEKRTYYRDDKETSLILQITHTGKKTFYLQKCFQGMTHMYFLGDTQEMNVNKAREVAIMKKLQLTQGIVVHEPVAESQSDDYTLKEIYDKYFEDKPDLRPSTVRNYQSLWIHEIAPRFAEKRLAEIDVNTLKRLHQEISQRAPYNANRVITFIKALYNYAIREDLYELGNPANSVRKNKEEPRTRYLTSDELEQFFIGVRTIRDDTTRDALLLMIFTGARKSNVLSMRWEDIDLRLKIWRIPQTKTGKNITLPLASSAVEILEDRKVYNLGNEPWVFPNVRSKSGHLENVKKSWQKITRERGLHNLRIHDLRHTMGTYLAANGASASTIQRALTHKSFQSSQIYVNLDVEHIREDVDKTVNSMMRIGNM